MSRVRLNIKSVEKRREWRGSLARERGVTSQNTPVVPGGEPRDGSRPATPIPIPVGLWTCASRLAFLSVHPLSHSRFSPPNNLARFRSFSLLDSVAIVTVDEKSWNGAWHDLGFSFFFFWKIVGK